ncbi:MarR family transcriptional regulator [Chromobacterium phragmitis]|uniref:MarR family transcriptional regulator n=1 Tax=Chromobacterium phragmitis TaxID=2202141 RepID=A0A344UDW8_9NEIS|nr:MarR family transcriptional regulator [Chromobacterium phragmitis]AXE32078.1 MarR family transcriptional regulator [Chromobacterium phragmitis]AXE33466.1 MarR family transcriptional regulator [Chromobacterium phragmitis]
MTLSKEDFERLADFRYRLRRFLRFSEDLAQDNGITPLQYQLLLQLKGYPGRNWATVAELAERLQSHHHSVVGLVSRCESQQLVRRQPGREDRRCVEVHLQEKGEQLVARLAGAHRDELLALQDHGGHLSLDLLLQVKRQLQPPEALG